MKVVVLAPDGRCIAGYGCREAGDFFDLPDELAKALAKRPDFRLETPAKKTKKEDKDE